AGIAQVSAMAGWDTRLTDADETALPSARERIERNLAGAVERGKVNTVSRDAALGKLFFSPSLAAACDGVDLVIEAVVEDAGIKQEVLARAARAASEGALFATNTSSLSVTAIAQRLPRPERFLGLHFFNPVHIMKLVEIVVHPGAAAATREEALAIVRALGKEPVVVQDSPGFASSRLGLVLGLEAMRMVEQGVASAADIDTAMKLGYNHPMGPLQLTDLVGLDVRLKIAEYLHDSLGGTQFEPPAILRRLVAEGKLGKKTGHGFYDWTTP
ncbi:MAG: 3-hydroxyacyl-CoA dehydrogenase family protein, partial [Gemmatimonadales bacterium]|nr:3-hydroxyacyl-CoA dehydrogenase family protein [Gemmatimonadales bacterium]